MVEASHPGIYERIGRGYSRYRIPDKRIQAQLDGALGDAQRICNVGAGTGSYEPEGRTVFALEPSLEMIQQRTRRERLVRGVAEALPFASDSFDAVMVVLSLHHWIDREAGMRELARIAPRRVLFGFEPGLGRDFWLVRDYLPEANDESVHVTPSVAQVLEWLGGGRSEVIPVHHDCSDGFLAAYWRRPERYFDPEVRACISCLSQIPEKLVDRALAELRRDLDSGAWEERNRALLERDAVDFGYRLIVSDAR